MLQKVERAVVGPVQVFELQHDRAAAVRCVAGRKAAEHLRRGVEGAVADLPGVVLDATDVAAVAEVQTDQVAQQVGVRLGHVGALDSPEQRNEPVVNLPFGGVDAVAVADLQPSGDDVAQQAVGLVLGQRVGTALEDVERLGPGFTPGLELVEQPALAQAGLADHGDQRRPALNEQAQEGALQCGEFTIAADHARLDTLDAAAGNAKRARLGAPHQVGGDGLVDALHRDAVLRLDLEHAAHVAVGVVADAKRARGSGLLHPSGNVDGDTADAAFGIDPAAEQHVAGVHADAYVEALVAMLALHFGAERAPFREQSKTAADSPLGIVFAGFVGPEHSQQVVAGVLQHLTVMGLDDGRAARQAAVHDGVDFLRVEVLAQQGRADDVEEQDVDLL